MLTREALTCALRALRAPARAPALFEIAAIEQLERILKLAGVSGHFPDGVDGEPDDFGVIGLPEMIDKLLAPKEGVDNGRACWQVDS